MSARDKLRRGSSVRPLNAYSVSWALAVVYDLSAEMIEQDFKDLEAEAYHKMSGVIE